MKPKVMTDIDLLEASMTHIEHLAIRRRRSTATGAPPSVPGREHVDCQAHAQTGGRPVRAPLVRRSRKPATVLRATPSCGPLSRRQSARRGRPQLAPTCHPAGRAAARDPSARRRRGARQHRRGRALTQAGELARISAARRHGMQARRGMWAARGDADADAEPVTVRIRHGVVDVEVT